MSRRRRVAAAIRAVPIAALALAAAGLVVFAVTWSPASAPDPLLVADLRGRALIVLDPSNPAAAHRIELHGGPHELLPLPNGRVLVSLEQSGALALVDIDRGDVERIEVGGLPHGLALDGGTVLVTDRASDEVRRFALDGWRELEPLPAGPWPHAVAVLPDGAVALTSADPGTLRVGNVETSVGRTTETLAVRSDGAVAAAAATDGIVVLVASDGTLLGRWKVGGRPVRVVFSPDGETLAVALSAGRGVALIAGDEIRRVSAAGVPDGLAFSADGRLVYASDVYGGALTAIDVRTGTVVAVIDAGVGTGAMLVAGR